MFDIGYSELLLIAVVALVVIGPKELPRVMRTVGEWIGKARGMARHFRSGIDTMIRESELEEMEKKWREENERIMREFPVADPAGVMAPLPPPADADAGAGDAAPPPMDEAPALPPAAEAPPSDADAGAGDAAPRPADPRELP